MRSHHLNIRVCRSAEAYLEEEMDTRTASGFGFDDDMFKVEFIGAQRIISANAGLIDAIGILESGRVQFGWLKIRLRSNLLALPSAFQ